MSPEILEYSEYHRPSWRLYGTDSQEQTDVSICEKSISASPILGVILGFARYPIQISVKVTIPIALLVEPRPVDW